MKIRLLSAVHPPPPGFESGMPDKKDLLVGPVAVFTTDPEAIYQLVSQRKAQMHAVVLVPGDDFQVQRLGELAWEMTIPPERIDGMCHTLHPFMQVLASNIQLSDDNAVMTQKLQRASRELHIREDDYKRVAEKLQGKVSDLMLARDEIMQLNQALEARVEARTSELAEANRDLFKAKELAEHANAAKSLFLAMMSHEIRTPMNGIVGLLELIAQTTLNADQERMIGIVRSSAFSLLNILNDILDFSKIEAEHLELDNVPLSILELVEGVAQTLAPGAYQKNIDLNCFVDPALPPTLIGDDVRIRQILFNLCSNAIKFTESGDERKGVVTLSATRVLETDRDCELLLEVKDNGIGMEADVQAKLFTPFLQGETSTTRRFGGTGLGLSICKRLTELLNGSIEVQSEKGQGTTFFVRLRLTKGVTDESGPLLENVAVAMLVKDSCSADIVRTYLESEKAVVTGFPDRQTLASFVDETAGNGDALPVMVLDLEDREDFDFIQSLQPELRHRDHWVVALAPYQLRMKAMPSCTLKTPVHPILKQELISSVGAVVGRCSPPVSGKAVAAEQVFPSGPLNRKEVCVLVAEDNTTNQEVIRQQMLRLGVPFVIVDNGSQALAVWQERNVDLILTDCHMPEMDGWQLARAIRQREQQLNQHVPIIAITANALRGEAQRCRDAGMDDYLAKPVELGQIREKLLKWLPVGLPTQTISVDKESETDMCCVVNLDFLREQIGDDVLIQSEILQQYLVDSRDTIATLQQAVTSGNWSETGFLAHKLKSSSRAIGAEHLASTCERVEELARGNEAEEIQLHAVSLFSAFAEVETFLKEYEAP